jgi:VanZ family protein
MSNQPGDISTRQSDFVVKIFIKLGIDLNGSLGELATLLIRKIAHFSEYFILGVFTMNLFNYYFKDKSQNMYSLIFIFFYASLDEVHQHFIPGRSMAFRDVIIDTLGGLIGILVYNMIINLKKQVK